MRTDLFLYGIIYAMPSTIFVGPGCGAVSINNYAEAACPSHIVSTCREIAKVLGFSKTWSWSLDEMIFLPASPLLFWIIIIQLHSRNVSLFFYDATGIAVEFSKRTMAGAPRIINLEDGWDNEIKKNAIDRLEAILNEGLDKKQSKMFSPGEYVQTYTTCYNMCTQVRGMISKTLHFYHHNRW